MKNQLSEAQKKQLVQEANKARRFAYTPYSRYPVGAALLTRNGKIVCGVNIDNAAYPATICAERVAVFKAVSEGHRSFLAIAVVTRDGGSPCGGCRQVLAEFGMDTAIIIANESGEILDEMKVSDLLPRAFGSGSLQP